MENPFHISTKIHVRFADCDMFGHVNNAKFITYMEQSRVEYFKHFPEIDFIEKKQDPDLSIILAEVTCTFKSPAYLDETLLVKIRASELKRSSFVMEYEMVEEKTSRLVATGRTVAVMFNYREQKSIPIPENIRKRFEAIEKRKW
ncbi:MAG: thioesterase family protein [bacterium]